MMMAMITLVDYQDGGCHGDHGDGDNADYEYGHVDNCNCFYDPVRVAIFEI